MTENSSTDSSTTDRRSSMLVYFLLNLIIGFLWRTFVPLTGWFDYLIGFLVGLVGLAIINREYGRRTYHLITFVFYVLWQIILSNLVLAWTIVQPEEKMNQRIRPAIVAVPLTVSRGLEIMLLASVITLTPGTISVDLGENEMGQQVLYIHNINLEDAAAFRREVKEGFEARILRFTRGATAT